jgi:hypothetical protein
MLGSALQQNDGFPWNMKKWNDGFRDFNRHDWVAFDDALFPWVMIDFGSVIDFLGCRY